MNFENQFNKILIDHEKIIKQLDCETLSKITRTLIQHLNQEGKILLCGNGGSLSLCQHFAAECLVRFEHPRPALPAIVLAPDSPSITAASNDFSFEEIFIRSLEALGNSNDVLLAFSTSGESRNVLQAVVRAQQLGISTIAFTGKPSSILAKQADLALTFSEHSTARLQEAHQLAIHMICDALDQSFSQ